MAQSALYIGLKPLISGGKYDIIKQGGRTEMYFLMNKNNVVATFDKKSATAFSDTVLFTEVERMGKLPFGFDDINTWIDSRKSSKHNTHLQKIMRQMGCMKS